MTAEPQLKQRVGDMTVDELREMLRELIQDAIKMAMKETQLAPTYTPLTGPLPTLDDFPVDDVGPWPEGLSLRREDMYGDDGR